MMFLIRTAFWLSVVIMLIPVDGKDESAGRTAAAEPIGAFEAASAAQAALSDVGGFCGRNPTTCEVGSRVGTTFMLKARTGARMVYEFIDGKLGGDKAERGTLTPSDLNPTWRGPKPAAHDI